MGRPLADLFPPGSVIAIVSPYLSGTGLVHCYLGVRTQTPLDTCSQLTTEEVDSSVFGEVVHHLMICRGNSLHVVKPNTSHDGVERG